MANTSPSTNPAPSPARTPQTARAGLVGRVEPEEGAAEHHPLDTEVEQPRLFAHGLAERRHHQWRRGHQTRGQHGGDEGDQGNAADGHG